MSDGARLSVGAARKRWRALCDGEPEGRALRVGVIATFEISRLIPYLGCRLHDAGFAPTIQGGEYNRVIEQLLDPTSGLRTRPPDVLFVFTRLEDLCPAILGKLGTLDESAANAARALADEATGSVIGAVERFVRAVPGCTVWCSSMPMPELSPLGTLDGAHPASVRGLWYEVNGRVYRQVREAGARVLDVGEMVEHLGHGRSFDRRMWYVARCPFSDEWLDAVAIRMVREVRPLFAPPVKVIVTDLDNTLWGGTLGEDGPAGLSIGDAGVGAAFADFQELLLAARARGVLLALASKNDETEALSVLDQHPAMRIRRRHLAGWRIGWQSKPSSLRELAAELNLGLDTFAFIDDDPHERELMRRMLPEVTVVDLPSDPAGYPMAFAASVAFDAGRVTPEDLGRADSYARASARPPLPAPDSDSATMREYLASLAIEVRVFRVGDGDVGRAAQLINRTNQFNLTMVRRSEGEVRALLQSSDVCAYGIRAQDRFGDYGFVGLAIVRTEAERPGWAVLDTFLLSCRALGRGIETALLAEVCAELSQRDVQHVAARFVPSARNAPAATFLPRHGFCATSNGEWALALEGRPVWAKSVAVVETPAHGLGPAAPVCDQTRLCVGQHATPQHGKM